MEGMREMVEDCAIVKISIHFGNGAAFFGVVCFCFRHLFGVSLFFFFHFPFVSALQVDVG
jgi:hypothetical protein